MTSPSKWVTHDDPDETDPADAVASEVASVDPADPADPASPPVPRIGPVTDDPGPKVLLPPPLVGTFVVPIVDGDPLVITQSGTTVDSAYVSWVLDAAAHSGIELREMRA